MERLRTAWEKWDQATTRNCLAYCEEYRSFISENKTERRCVRAAAARAEGRGFREISSFTRLAPGDRFYRMNKHKSIILGVAGSQPLASGGRFIIAHVDTPRIDLKAHPVHERHGIAFLKTAYYGGLRKYQWLARPLALYATVCLPDGTVREFAVGDTPGDPVFTITDLLPHLAKDHENKTIAEGFPGEHLTILAGTIPAPGSGKQRVRAQLLSLLKDAFSLSPDDFVSAEIQAVPAGDAHDAGFDRSLIAGYGQDDRVCAYTALTALLETEHPSRTCLCLLVDQEEIGSQGATAAASRFFEYLMQELLEKTGGSLSDFPAAMVNSQAISADVTAGFDPGYPEVHDPLNAARVGHGVCLERTTGARGKRGSIEPTAEYLAFLRGVFDRAGVPWQAGEIGKPEQGGGGTVAFTLARHLIDTADCGPPVLSMHAPCELVSKADIYSAHLAYAAFFRESRLPRTK